MTREETIRWLERIEERYIHGGDESYDEARKEALRMAIEALEKYEEAYEHGWTEAECKYREILERKRGEWIDDGYQGYSCVCSVCGTPQEIKAKFLFSFCPNCGAEMRGDTDE